MKVCVILCVIGRIQAKMEAPGVRAWRARPLKPHPSTWGGGDPGGGRAGGGKLKCIRKARTLETRKKSCRVKENYIQATAASDAD